ncbi:MAG: DUF1444 family protein [Planctomycetes bacterium]|nr:DUF1444 family protein [Planctomycetota bacterium]
MSKIPSHWLTHHGQNHWYTVAFPPGWTLEMTEGTATLTAPEGGGTLTISAFWNDETPPQPLADFVNLNRIFPRRRKVQPLKAVGDSDDCLGFQGQFAVEAHIPWWKRIFRKGLWKHFRIWGLRREPVHLIAFYLQGPRVDQEAETVAGMIVDSLQVSRHPAYPPDVFVRRVLDLARAKFPLLECASAPDFQIRLGDSKINLFNFYRSYVQAPDQFETIVLPALTTVVQVQEWGTEQTEPELDSVARRIMPMLYPEEVWRQQFPQIVGRPWIGGLVVLYVIDESQAYWYIREDLVETWGITVDELHERALENLERYFEDQPMEFNVAGAEDGPRLLVPTRQDAYNTSRLLSEGFHRKMRGVLGGDFAVGTPSRDFFVAISLQSPEVIERVRRSVVHDFQTMDHPLSERLFLVTVDGVTEYSPWAEFPADESGSDTAADDIV